jgi:chromosome segregation ATPase
MIEVLLKESKELKDKATASEQQLNDFKQNFNRVQRECDKTKQELQQVAEERLKYQNMFENLKTAGDRDKQSYEPQLRDLTEQLEEYAEAYKVLEEKLKIAQAAALPSPEPAQPKEDKKADDPRIKDKDPPRPKDKDKDKDKDKEAKAKDKDKDKDAEGGDNTVGALKKRIAEDIEAKKALRELIKAREDTIRKQKDMIEGQQKQIDASKSEIQYLQSQLTQKNSQLKSLTAKLNELMQDRDKPKGPPEDKKTKPKTAAGLVKQKIKEEKLEKVEAKPYLFGPKMDDELI